MISPCVINGFVQFAEKVDKLWSYGERSNVYKTGFAVVGPIEQRTHLGTGTARSSCVSFKYVALFPAPPPPSPPPGGCIYKRNITTLENTLTPI